MLLRSLIFLSECPTAEQMFVQKLAGRHSKFYIFILDRAFIEILQLIMVWVCNMTVVRRTTLWQVLFFFILPRIQTSNPSERTGRGIGLIANHWIIDKLILSYIVPIKHFEYAHTHIYTHTHIHTYTHAHMSHTHIYIHMCVFLIFIIYGVLCLSLYLILALIPS